MADPKYANLPGIAYDQPDCYETNDLPESDQNEDYFEQENEDIERLHLNASEAFNKFKGKSLDSNAVDFSDRLSRKLRTGYDARSGDWELVGEGEKETPMQKFQRLQCEIKELVEEVSMLKETSKDAVTKEQTPCKMIAGQLELAQKQLLDLRLEETLGSDLIGDLADPQGSQLMKLLSQLDSLKSSGAAPEKKSPAKAGAKSHAGSGDPGAAGEPGIITYQLNYRPEHARLAQTTRMAELEQKLHNLEAVVGTSSDKLARLSAESQQSGLLEVARRMSARANLLDSAQLDHVEARLAALATKMDSVAEKGATSPDDAERDKKVLELYEIAKKSEAMTDLLPQTLERMKALESLHHQAADFSKSLTQLESLQQQITANLQNNEELVKGVEKSFQQNLETIKKNMTSLDARIASLKPKK